MSQVFDHTKTTVIMYLSDRNFPTSYYNELKYQFSEYFKNQNFILMITKERDDIVFIQPYDKQLIDLFIKYKQELIGCIDDGKLSEINRILRIINIKYILS